ncbi:hypothetical protein [Rubritalea tangerina]
MLASSVLEFPARGIFVFGFGVKLACDGHQLIRVWSEGNGRMLWV